MAEVREMTRMEDILANSVINSAVIPSAKYSCSTSPDRFSKGSTASEWMRTGDDLGRMDCRKLPRNHPNNKTNIPTTTRRTLMSVAVRHGDEYGFETGLSSPVVTLPVSGIPASAAG